MDILVKKINRINNDIEYQLLKDKTQEEVIKLIENYNKLNNDYIYEFVEENAEKSAIYQSGYDNGNLQTISSVEENIDTLTNILEHIKDEADDILYKIEEILIKKEQNDK